METKLTPEQETDLQRFGRRLADLRKARGWSQERLAVESGLARSYLGGVERGQRNIAVLNILRLAQTLASPASCSDTEGNRTHPFLARC